jgi:hypothetical protein
VNGAAVGDMFGNPFADMFADPFVEDPFLTSR